MFGIVVTNRGLWGITTWVKRDGKPILHETREEAEAAAERYNKAQGPVNRFNEYYAQEY